MLVLGFLFRVKKAGFNCLTNNHVFFSDKLSVMYFEKLKRGIELGIYVILQFMPKLQG